MVSPTNRISALDVEPQQGFGDESPQVNLPRLFWRRRWWILACVVACVAGSAAYHAKQVPLYQSASRLYIQQNGPQVMGDGKGLGVAQTVGTQVELIKSTPLLSTVAEKPEVRGMGILRGVDNPVGLIKSGLSVAAEKDGDFVDIAFTSTDSSESAQMANAVVDAYSTYMEKQRQNTAAVVLSLLQEQKDARDAEFKAKLQETLEFKRKNEMLSFLDDRGNIITEKLGVLSSALTQAQIATIDAQAHADWVAGLEDDPRRLLESARAEARQSGGPTVRVDAGGADALPEMRDDVFQRQADDVAQKVRDAELSLRAMENARTDRHYDVKKAEADLELLRRQAAEANERIEQRRADALQRLADLKRERVQAQTKLTTEQERELVEGYTADAQRRLLLAKQREEQLDAAFKAQREMAFSLNSVAVEAQARDADLDRLAKATSALDDKIRSINVNEDTSIPNVHILEVAKASAEPVNADLGRSLAMGLVMGLMLGGGLAYGVDLLDQRIRSAEELQQIMDAPVLGLVPHIGGDAEKDFSRGRVVASDPTSDVSESYRTIRTAVQFAMRNANVRRILVTSAAPGEGKSSTASNLALSMAQAGKRVLLIDADCRKPTQHKIFGQPAEVGLSTVLGKGTPPSKAITGSGLAGAGHLHLLPCGPIPGNPAELLNGQRFADLLDAVGAKFDLVIIDSPPVVPVTDARILAALCDATIFVVKADKTTRRLAQHAREGLESVGAQLMGVVVNDVPRRRDRYGYYYGYGYGYRYYQYEYGGPKADRPVPVSNGHANGHANGSTNGNGHANGGGAETPRATTQKQLF